MYTSKRGFFFFFLIGSQDLRLDHPTTIYRLESWRNQEPLVPEAGASEQEGQTMQPRSRTEGLETPW